MAVIPDNFIINSSNTGITLDFNNPNVHHVTRNPNVHDTTIDNMIISDSLKLPDSYLASYNSDNFDLVYHDEVDFNSLPKNVILDINNPVIYYKPNTFKYGSQYYVPSYEDTVYLSNLNLNQKIKRNPSSTYSKPTSIPLIQPNSTSKSVTSTYRPTATSTYQPQSKPKKNDFYKIYI
jgi:hypothetical protein